MEDFAGLPELRPDGLEEAVGGAEDADDVAVVAAGELEGDGGFEGVAGVIVNMERAADRSVNSNKEGGSYRNLILNRSSCETPSALKASSVTNPYDLCLQNGSPPFTF